MRDFPRTVISQYSNSPVLTQLIENFNECVDPDFNLENFYNLIFNIDTAVGYGLDVWGRIVGIGRVLKIDVGAWFGWNQQPESEGWDQAPWWSGHPVTDNFTLSDQAYRQLIFAKAAANITNGSILAINAILMDILFPGRGNVFVVDGQDMTMTYRFNFTLEPFERSIVINSGVLPTPAGVLAVVVTP